MELYISVFFASLPQTLISLYFHCFIALGKPQIIEKTDNSVTMTWTRSTKIGQSSLLGYTVEMYGRNDTDGWVPVEHRLQDTTYTHTGLTAGISYYFVIRAENTHGMSAPSAVSDPVIVGIVSNLLLIPASFTGFLVVNIYYSFNKELKTTVDFLQHPENEHPFQARKFV